jgi:hypothetical protein
MKRSKIVSAGLIALAMLAGPSSARADFDRVFPLGSDFLMTAGVKLWAASWQTGNFSFTSQEGSNSASYGAAAAAAIPSISFKMKNVFLSASALSSGEFDFPAQTDMISLSGAGGTATLLETDSKATRDEVDANLGVYVTPGLAFSVGYKGITQEFTVKNRSLSGPATIPTTTVGKTKYAGPTFGMLVGAPLGGGFTAYGNFVGGILSQEFEPSVPGPAEPDSFYEGAELGVVFKAKNTPLSFTVGYKYQVIDNTTNDKAFKDQNVIDLTRGFIFGLNLFL